MRIFDDKSETSYSISNAILVKLITVYPSNLNFASILCIPSSKTYDLSLQKILGTQQQ